MCSHFTEGVCNRNGRTVYGSVWNWKGFNSIILRYYSTNIWNIRPKEANFDDFLKTIKTTNISVPPGTTRGGHFFSQITFKTLVIIHSLLLVFLLKCMSQTEVWSIWTGKILLYFIRLFYRTSLQCVHPSKINIFIIIIPESEQKCHFVLLSMHPFSFSEA